MIVVRSVYYCLCEKTSNKMEEVALLDENVKADNTPCLTLTPCHGYSCWMSLTPFYYAFLLPMALVMLANIVIYILVVVSICRRGGLAARANRSQASQRAVTVRASFACFVALGELFSWSLTSRHPRRNTSGRITHSQLVHINSEHKSLNHNLAQCTVATLKGNHLSI